ncbi:MAG: shikimate dehydrogenase [Mogibacterium sp.]|nr:shikimate dehydrogenase [Mogibacterium sp.]
MKYGLIGEKLGHSFSKEIHGKLGRYEYELKELAADELEAFIKGRDFEGINVTIPYKEAVIPLLDDIDEAAGAIGAVNTIVNKNGRLTGYNTDAFGMMSMLQMLGVDAEGKCVLIAGSGGTSKTAAYVAGKLGASEIKRISRNPRGDAISYEEAYKRYGHADILINTTPVGMFPNTDACPLDLSAFSRAECVTDVVYNPLNTRLVQEARERGIAAEGGLYMLVAQAVRAAELFTGDPVESGTTDLIYSELMMEKINIALIGMPGSGKTSIGRILAEKLEREFTDSDEEIIKEAGMDIAEIFERYGEKYFRDLEAEVIKKISLTGSKIIATGGGAVLRKENVEALRLNSVIVLLNRSLEELEPTSDRPLSDDIDKLRRLYEARMPIYRETADIITDPEGFDEPAAMEIWRSLL